MRLFFSAGEASGDAYAAALLTATCRKVRARPAECLERRLRRRLIDYFDIEDAASLDDAELERRIGEIDSLDSVELMMAIEDEYGIERDEDWAGLGYVGGMNALASRIRVVWPDEILIQALGGKRVQAAGAKLVADSTAWGAIGIAESLKVYPKARLGLAKAQKALSEGEPGVFVPIDYGYLNIGLSRFAKELGWKVVYFSPPGAWRKDRQGPDLPKVTDSIITPFSWSAEILNQMGGNAHWFGHPIKQMIREAPSLSRGTSDEEGVRGGDKRGRLAILPGSRRSEANLLLPVFAKALEGFEEPVEFAIATSLDLEQIKAKWAQLAPSRQTDVFTPGDTYSVLRRAKAAIVCSGTATLEAALCRCPHLVVYKVSKAVEAQARLIGFKVPLIAQPNILLDRMVVKELVQHGATPEAVREEFLRVLNDERLRQDQLGAFEALDRLLGPDDAIDRSAELIAGYLK